MPPHQTAFMNFELYYPHSGNHLSAKSLLVHRFNMHESKIIKLDKRHKMLVDRTDLEAALVLLRYRFKWTWSLTNTE